MFMPGTMAAGLDGRKGARHRRYARWLGPSELCSVAYRGRAGNDNEMRWKLFGSDGSHHDRMRYPSVVPATLIVPAGGKGPGSVSEGARSGEGIEAMAVQSNPDQLVGILRDTV